MTSLPYLMRDAEADDVRFIVDAWVREMRRSVFSRHVRNDVFVPGQHDVVHALLGDSSVTMACDRDNPSLLMGCVVWEHGPEPIIHWLYVKSSYRRLGIARSLLLSCYPERPARVICSQATQLFDDPAFRPVLERYGVVYSPYVLLGIPVPSAALEAAPAEHMTG